MRDVYGQRNLPHTFLNESMITNGMMYCSPVTFLCIMPRYVHPSSQHRAFPGSLLGHTEDHWIHLDSYHYVSKSIL